MQSNQLKHSNHETASRTGLAVLLAGSALAVLAGCGGSAGEDIYVPYVPPPPKQLSEFQFLALEGTQQEVSAVTLSSHVAESQTAPLLLVTDDTRVANFLAGRHRGSLSQEAWWGCYYYGDCGPWDDDDYTYLFDDYVLRVVGYRYSNDATITPLTSDPIIVENGQWLVEINDDYRHERITLRDTGYNSFGTSNVYILSSDGAFGNGNTHVASFLITGTNNEWIRSADWAFAGVFGADPGIYGGKATFNGVMTGIYQPTPGDFRWADGDATLTVNFTSGDLDGRIEGISADGSAFPDIVILPGGVSSADPNIFIGVAETDMTGYVGDVGSMAGAYNSSLYGWGQEIGGTLALANETESLVGAFVGK